MGVFVWDDKNVSYGKKLGTQEEKKYLIKDIIKILILNVQIK